MGPTSPETTTPRTITTLASRVTEIPYSREITVKTENVGMQQWGEMLDRMDNEGKEMAMDVFRNVFTGSFATGSIVEYDERGYEHKHDKPIRASEIGGLKSFTHDPVVSLHTHPLSGDEAHIKTSIPSGNDIRTFLSSMHSALVIVDRGGSHLLVRTREFHPRNPESFESVLRKGSKRRPLQHASKPDWPDEEDLPPDDLMKKKIKEIAARGGVVADVQKELNGMIAQYGLRYFYTEQLTPNEDGTITFKTP